MLNGPLDVAGLKILQVGVGFNNSLTKIMRVNMVEEEKIEYKDIALESTGRVLRDLVGTEKMRRA